MSAYGNPELPMEKTVMYELGYDHELFEQYLLLPPLIIKTRATRRGVLNITARIILLATLNTPFFLSGCSRS
jgi:hypothetical protein